MNYKLNGFKSMLKQGRWVEQRDRHKNVVKVYPSLREVERQLGYDHGNISRCCNNKQENAYGYTWRFV